HPATQDTIRYEFHFDRRQLRIRIDRDRLHENGLIRLVDTRGDKTFALSVDAVTPGRNIPESKMPGIVSQDIYGSVRRRSVLIDEACDSGLRVLAWNTLYVGVPSNGFDLCIELRSSFRGQARRPDRDQRDEPIGYAFVGADTHDAAFN